MITFLFSLINEFTLKRYLPLLNKLQNLTGQARNTQNSLNVFIKFMFLNVVDFVFLWIYSMASLIKSYKLTWKTVKR